MFLFVLFNIANCSELSFLFSDPDYISFKELYYPGIDENDPFNTLNLYQKRLLQNRHRENGTSNKKLAVRLVCSCGRSFSYLAGYRSKFKSTLHKNSIHLPIFRYHNRWECGKILSCKHCGKVYTDKSNLVKHMNVCRNKLIQRK